MEKETNCRKTVKTKAGSGIASFSACPPGATSDCAVTSREAARAPFPSGTRAPGSRGQRTEEASCHQLHCRFKFRPSCGSLNSARGNHPFYTVFPVQAGKGSGERTRPPGGTVARLAPADQTRWPGVESQSSLCPQAQARRRDPTSRPRRQCLLFLSSGFGVLYLSARILYRRTK